VTTSLAVRPRSAPVERTIVGGVPLVRMRPAPQFDPPYDDEPAAPVRVLGPVDEPGPPERSEDPERLWGPAPAGPAGGLPPRAGTGGQAAYRYVGLCLEVLEGYRPATHLRRLTLAAAFENVLDQLSRPAARTGHPSSGGPAPQATGGRPTPGGAPPTRRGDRGADRLRLRRLWVGEPSDGVVEAAAVVGRADRAWALALRLERRGDRWLCIDLQVV
jgi:hypothetical protein